MSDILEVEGANGEPVPYAGYVEVSLKFSKEFIASEPEVETLALIVPDTRSNSSIPVLIGTNILDPLYEEYCDDNTLRSTTFCGYAQVLKTLQLRHQQRSGGRLGLVKLRGSTPATIPAGEKVVLQGFAGAKTVTKSQSPFSSPIVVVKKKNGDIRLCVDYRKLNLQTIKDLIWRSRFLHSVGLNGFL